MSLYRIIGIFCILPIIISKQTETIPTDIKIWETGISFDKIFIIRSSNAKLAIATVIKKIPRRFSNFSPNLKIKTAFYRLFLINYDLR